MYLVFIAMVALNVSGEVLGGFEKVGEGLHAMLKGTETRNSRSINELSSAYQIKPEKAEKAFSKGKKVRDMADSLCNFLEESKQLIVQKADGKPYTSISAIVNKEDMNAPSGVMLNPVTTRATKARKMIESFRILAMSNVSSQQKKKSIEETLTTKSTSSKSWEEELFESMPTIASVTLITKLQTDIRNVEGDVLRSLINDIDDGDLRVNKIEAQVIPESRIVMRGDTYRAQIVLSSFDSLAKPKIVINGKELPSSSMGVFTASTSSTGIFPLKGYIETIAEDGSTFRRDFNSEYIVTEALASVSPTMMNVLYAGIDNPLQIAVPGAASEQVSATMTNGSITHKGNLWVARPSKVGEDAVISVYIKNSSGVLQKISDTKLRVRRLPDPLPYIEYQNSEGSLMRFKGGTISKKDLLNSKGVKAAIDDDIIDVKYNVTSFQLTFFDAMGNAIPEVSHSSQFSERQLRSIRNLSRGKRFYISEVIASGPDGINRKIPPIEVIIK